MSKFNTIKSHVVNWWRDVKRDNKIANLRLYDRHIKSLRDHQKYHKKDSEVWNKLQADILHTEGLIEIERQKQV